MTHLQNVRTFASGSGPSILSIHLSHACLSVIEEDLHLAFYSCLLIKHTIQSAIVLVVPLKHCTALCSVSHAAWNPWKAFDGTCQAQNSCLR